MKQSLMLLTSSLHINVRVLLQEQLDDCLVTAIRHCLERTAVKSSLRVDIHVLQEQPADCLMTLSRCCLECIAIVSSPRMDVCILLQEQPDDHLVTAS